MKPGFFLSKQGNEQYNYGICLREFFSGGAQKQHRENIHNIYI